MRTARPVAVLGPMLLAILAPSHAQDQAQFEVASVKANTSGSAGIFDQHHA